MSRPRKSREEHELTGSKQRLTLPDDNIPEGKPTIPRNLSKDAKATFRRLARMLQQRRHLSAGDSEILRLYCVAFERHVRATAHLAEEGEIVTSQRASKSGELYDVTEKNPWLEISVSAEKYMR